MSPRAHPTPNYGISACTGDFIAFLLSKQKLVKLLFDVCDPELNENFCSTAYGSIFVEDLTTICIYLWNLEKVCVSRMFTSP